MAGVEQKKRQRKRKRPKQSADEGQRKRLRKDGLQKKETYIYTPGKGIHHPLLTLYYSSVRTLRDYLVHNLPDSSKSRRRRILSLPLYEDSPHQKEPGHAEALPDKHDELNALSKLLDMTLVGESSCKTEPREERLVALAQYSQHPTGSTADSSNGLGPYSQMEIVDLSIWLLFNKTFRTVNKPSHLLCNGFQRSSAAHQPIRNHDAASGIPGLVCLVPNTYVNSLKSPLWQCVLSMLGKEGERIMINLLMDCGLFGAVGSGVGNFVQLSGIPLSDMPPLQQLSDRPSNMSSLTLEQSVKGSRNNLHRSGFSPMIRQPMSIAFVRSRMLYARAALNGKGEVRFGLRHIHVLNRYSDSTNTDHIVHIMKYIFPRQFRLHNVFTSTVNTRETIQPFQDYTLREKEIARAQHSISCKVMNNQTSTVLKSKLPKRLRGEAVRLVGKLQQLHGRCSYTELLRHHCRVPTFDGPVPSDAANKVCTQGRKGITSTSFVTQASLSTLTFPNKATPGSDKMFASPGKCSLIEFATPTAEVSAFCRAVISSVFPNQLWGPKSHSQENERALMRSVDRFIHLRRFESLSLHEVLQNIKTAGIPWLKPEKHQEEKSSRSDHLKRLDIFQELVYYLFDSFLIPLIRSNFYVTESNVHRNRIFFFRHDIWKYFSEPSMASLRITMFEELKTDDARRLLEKRSLGFSQIRLLPKETGVRPIMNLKRRVIKKQSGKDILGRSINSVMTPAYNMLNYEKGVQPQKLGSALFSVGDIYSRLKSFKSHLKARGQNQNLFFAKVDVQSCFDTIPQDKVIRLVERLLSEDEYRFIRHAELKACETHQYFSRASIAVKPARKFVAKARASEDYSPFEKVAGTELAQGKKDTIFVETVAQTLQDKKQLIALLQEHVQQNIVKIGKKFYRQKEGIPQGSITSSLLCNFFYADLERQCLGFLDPQESILLRLIDDFLLITTNRTHARRFLQMMHDGDPTYGVSVNSKKSLTNFEITINGAKVPRVQCGSGFPYCGSLIDSRTLAISKDRERRKDSAIADSLTVEYSKLPGRTFHRKILNAFKIQTHLMFLDTSFNTLATVLSNIYENFIESAMKYYRYAKSLPSPKRPTSSLLIGTIQDLIGLAFVLIKSKSKKVSSSDYVCSVTRVQVDWLACTAFRKVLARKQSGYRQVLMWLDDAIAKSRCKIGVDAARLRKVVRAGEGLILKGKY